MLAASREEYAAETRAGRGGIETVERYRGGWTAWCARSPPPPAARPRCRSRSARRRLRPPRALPPLRHRSARCSSSARWRAPRKSSRRCCSRSGISGSRSAITSASSPSSTRSTSATPSSCSRCSTCAFSPATSALFEAWRERLGGDARRPRATRRSAARAGRASGTPLQQHALPARARHQAGAGRAARHRWPPAICARCAGRSGRERSPRPDRAARRRGLPAPHPFGAAPQAAATSTC